MLAIYGAIFWACGAFLAAVSQAASSFGFGILMLLFWQFTGLLKDKIPVYEIQYAELQFVTVLASLPLNVYMAGYGVWKKHYSIPLMAMMATIIPGMSFVGARIMLTMDMSILKIVLGIFFLLFSLGRLGGDGFQELKLRRQTVETSADPPTISPACISRRGKKWEYAGWFLASVASGVLIGLFGAGGPPFMIYLTMVDTHPTVFRTCLGVANVVSAARSILMILTPGVVQWQGHAVLYTMCVCACVCGAFVGNKLHTKVDRKNFLRIIMVLLLVCAITMLCDIRSKTVGGRIGLILVCTILVVGFAALLLLVVRNGKANTFEVLEDEENPHTQITPPDEIVDAPASPTSRTNGDRTAVEPWTREMMQMDRRDLPCDDSAESPLLPSSSRGFGGVSARGSEYGREMSARGYSSARDSARGSAREMSACGGGTSARVETSNPDASTAEDFDRQNSQNSSHLHRAFSRFSS